MRPIRLVLAAMLLFVSAPAYAQAWAQYTDQSNFFTVNFPGEPKKEAIPFKTPQGTTLPAWRYTASRDDSHYTVTVINYATAPQEVSAAVGHAGDDLLKRGKATYDAAAQIDRIPTRRMAITEPDGRRLLGEIALHQNRVYILEADVPASAPPPMQFQASIQILDATGKPIRYNEDGVTRAN